MVPVAGGIEEIADRYDGFILDVWGVLHNGVEPYPRVVDTLYRLKSAGKRLCILSNAPVQAETVAGRIETIGIPRDAYHHIMTSGEEVWQHLKHRPDAFYKGLGRKVLHIGPERDRGMLDGWTSPRPWIRARPNSCLTPARGSPPTRSPPISRCWMRPWRASCR